jgi:hypothetical protein
MTPLLKIPIILPGNQEEKDPDKEVDARIDVEEISYFHDCYYWGTLIVMKSGQVIMTKMDADAFEKKVFKHCEKYLIPC